MRVSNRRHSAITLKMRYNTGMNKTNDKSSARKRALKELLLGAAVAIAGAVMTYASYEGARAGESYTIYTGLIVVGAIYALKGLYGVILPFGLKGLKQRKMAENPIEVDASESKQPKDEADSEL